MWYSRCDPWIRWRSRGLTRRVDLLYRGRKGTLRPVSRTKGAGDRLPVCLGRTSDRILGASERWTRRLCPINGTTAANGSDRDSGNSGSHSMVALVARGAGLQGPSAVGGMYPCFPEICISDEAEESIGKIGVDPTPVPALWIPWTRESSLLCWYRLIWGGFLLTF